MNSYPWTFTQYLLRRILAFFVALQFVAVTLYVIVDWFERSTYFLKYDISFFTMATYYAYKLPLILAQTVGPASGTALILALTISNRYGEVLALRAGGVGTVTFSTPILAATFLLSIFLLTWSEVVVPPTASRAQQINLTQIKMRDRKSFLAEEEVWLRGRLGFYHVGLVDRKRQTLLGVSIFVLGDHFRLEQVALIPALEWRDNRWRTSGSGVVVLGGSDSPLPKKNPSWVATLVQSIEPFGDFVELQRETEELSFRELRAQILRLRARGIDASHLLPELYLKLAVPFVPTVLAFAFVPIAIASRFRHATHRAILLGGAVGFVYWLLLALAQSLPATSPITAVLVAWAPNLVFVMIGITAHIRLR